MSRVLRKHRALHISRITGGGNHCSSAIILHSAPLQVHLSGSLGSLSQVLDTSCNETYCDAYLCCGGLRPKTHEPLLMLHNLSMLDCYRVTACAKCPPNDGETWGRGISAFLRVETFASLVPRCVTAAINNNWWQHNNNNYPVQLQAAGR